MGEVKKPGRAREDWALTQSPINHSADCTVQYTCSRSCAEPHWVEEIGGSDPRELVGWWGRQESQQMQRHGQRKGKAAGDV